MATTPFPYSPSLRPALHKVWIPVLLGLTMICFESTPIMGGNHTARWLSFVWPPSFGSISSNFFIDFHHMLRKLGHFSGYGTLGLLFRKAWQRSVRAYLGLVGAQLKIGATALAVSCVFLVGSLDEWHQSFIPGRTSKCSDVLIDTCGALVFTLAFWAIRYFRRRSLIRQSTFRSLRAV
ncbi:MAG: hypothetical protein NVSMB62_14640 [Acidobacteriaceae bacterium]